MWIQLYNWLRASFHSVYKPTNWLTNKLCFPFVFSPLTLLSFCFCLSFCLSCMIIFYQIHQLILFFLLFPAARQCSVYGDPHFRTFDLENYEFLAEGCEYFLVSSTAAFANDARITITTEQSVVSTITQVNSVTISETVSVNCIKKEANV